MVPMKRLFFDLETLKNLDALEFAPEPKADGKLKDTEKILADIEAKKVDLIERAALDPDYGQIASFGYATDGDTTQLNCVLSMDVGEKELLKRFWDEFDNCNGMCVGFNIMSFDIPYVMRRSFALGIQHPKQVPNLAKFRSEPITDLFPLLYNWQSYGKGLKQIAKMYGLAVMMPDVDGSMYEGLSTEDRIKYQISDVYLNQQLYNKMNGIYFVHNDSLVSHRAIVKTQKEAAEAAEAEALKDMPAENPEPAQYDIPF